MNVNNAVSCLALPAAFDRAEGRVRTFQIVLAEVRRDDHVVDS